MAGWKLRKDKTDSDSADSETAEELPAPGDAAPPSVISPINPATGELRRWEVSADTPVTEEEIQHEISTLLNTHTSPLPGISGDAENSAEETQHEKIEFAFAPIELGKSEELGGSEELSGNEIAHDAPRFSADEDDTDDEEDAEPAPHFDDDETTSEITPDFGAAIPLPMPPPEAIAIAPPPASPAEEISEEISAEPPAPSTPLFAIPSPILPEMSTSTLRMDRSDLASLSAPPSGFSVPPVSPFLLDVPKVTAPETPHTLLVRIGRLSATFEMTKEVTVIGRPDSEMHFYPDIEIEMDDAVSRRHAEILRHEEDFYLVDAGSTNGTLLNGEMLTPHEERLLAHGDRIRVGERTEIIFE